MTGCLGEKELEELKKRFRLTVERHDSKLSANVLQLLNADFLRKYISELQPRINAANKGVAASMLAKRYSFFAVLILYVMTVHNKALKALPENVSIETEAGQDIWLPKIRLDDLDVLEAPSDNREQWRDALISELFAKNMNLFLTALSKETKISKYILWENVSVYIFWLYETLLSETQDDAIRKRAAEDFEYVVQKANGSLFGSYNTNPLARYYSVKGYVKELDDTVRLRKTCCLSYLSEKGSRCKTCPQLCTRPSLPKGTS